MLFLHGRHVGIDLAHKPSLLILDSLLDALSECVFECLHAILQLVLNLFDLSLMQSITLIKLSLE